MTLISVLKLIKTEGKLLNCLKINYKNVPKTPLSSNSFQTAIICLSQYGQSMISNYVALFKNSIPLMSKNSTKNINMQLFAIKKYLLSNMIQLYTYGNGIDSNNDFLLMHSISGAWSLIQILPLLLSPKNNENNNNNNNIQEQIQTETGIQNVNNAVLQFLCVSIALYVTQFEVDIILPTNNYNNNNNTLLLNEKMVAIVDKIRQDVKNHIFVDEHTYKAIVIILECLKENIIDDKCAYYAMKKVSKPFTIASMGGVIAQNNKNNNARL